MSARFLRLPRERLFPFVVAIALLPLVAFGAAGREARVVVDGRERIVVTRMFTARGVLHESGVRVKATDVVEPSGSIEPGEAIVVRTEKLVTLRYNGIAKPVRTHAATVAELANELGLTASTVLFLTRPQERLAPGREVALADLRVELSRRRVAIDAGGHENPRGTGVKEVLVRRIFAGPRLLAEQLVSERVVRRAVVARRPRYLAARLASRGAPRQKAEPPVAQGRSLTVVATAYAPGAGAGYRTATGRRAGRGVVAVDPSVIPLGTRLYIPGYGYGVAADTGGAIKGHRIDVCFDTAAEAIRWGRRRVTVVVLD